MTGQNSTKQIALMEDRISTKQNSTKQMALTKNTISTRQIALKENTVSTKQMALMEERISSWNMNGSVPILTFTGRGEYLSQINSRDQFYATGPRLLKLWEGAIKNIKYIE